MKRETHKSLVCVQFISSIPFNSMDDYFAVDNDDWETTTGDSVGNLDNVETTINNIKNNITTKGFQ